jgi:butyryl-CoA dehydrogenase
MSIDVASNGVQVHGGMGYIEEAGAAQYYRDARILTIYEGTTAIQANDLVGRKTARDAGAMAKVFVAQMRRTAAELSADTNADLAAIGRRLSAAADAYAEVVDDVVSRARSDVRSVFAGSVPYLKLAGIVHGGWHMGRAALAAKRKLDAGNEDAPFLSAKIVTARFFADHLLTAAVGLRDSIIDGAAGVLGLPAEHF